MRKLRYKFVCNFDGPQAKFYLVSHDYINIIDYDEDTVDDKDSLFVIDKDFSNTTFLNFDDNITDEIVSQITEYKLKLRKLKLNKV